MANANEQILVEGLRVFPPPAAAPEFVKGSVILTLDDLNAFAKKQAAHATKYNGKDQFRLKLLESKQGGLYFALDTYKPGDKPAQQAAPKQSTAATATKPQPQEDGNDDFPF